MSTTDNDPVRFLNMERTRLRVPVLERNPELDWLAQVHAFHMAKVENVFHSADTIEELKRRLGAPVVGENVQRGDSIFTMLCKTMDEGSTVNRGNMLSEHYTQFGSATATGRDGKIYFCQVFRGGVE